MLPPRTQIWASPTPGVRHDSTGRDLVLARLEKDTGPDDEWSALVLAALESPDDLGHLLADGNGAAQIPADRHGPGHERLDTGGDPVAAPGVLRGTT